MLLKENVSRNFFVPNFKTWKQHRRLSNTSFSLWHLDWMTSSVDINTYISLFSISWKKFIFFWSGVSMIFNMEIREFLKLFKKLSFCILECRLFLLVLIGKKYIANRGSMTIHAPTRVPTDSLFFLGGCNVWFNFL